MKTIQTIAEVKLIYRTKVKASERPQVKSSKDAFEIFMESWDLDTIEHTEEFKLMLLNRSNKVLGISSLSKGGTTGTVVDVKLLLQYTIKVNANAIILCHNHPSGNLQPSEADMAITRKVKEAVTLMDIQLLDHLIIVPEGRYYSFGDEGIL
jgi:DNA repair protein RadC